MSDTPRVAALYRYPVKGFTPERCDALDVLADGRIAGDRILGLRFASDPTPDDAWSRKTNQLVLVNTPGLARLQLRFDATARRLCLALDGAVLVDDSIDGPGRARIAAAVEAFALTLDESPLRDRPDHLPLRLVGDGRTPRFQDAAAGEVTLHGRASLSALAEALGDHDLDEVRFRSNVAIDGLAPWQEMGWTGGTIRAGEVVFDVHHAVTRCLATEANPSSGERDREVLLTLTRAFGQPEPTFAVALRARNPGCIRLGDAIEVL